jgi:uncharacterized membrane protein YeaQ/YmgE (transglycosylase-associated protein family)
MGILAWVVAGLAAGWLASLVMRSGYGIVSDLIVGVVGAVIGGFLAAVFLNIPDPVNGINLASIFVAFVGALILIALLRLISGRSRVRV